MFDPTKPVRTRDGRAVTILATDVRERILGVDAHYQGGETILARIDRTPTERARVEYFYASGRLLKTCEDSRDLVNVPETIERFFAVYFSSEPQLDDPEMAAIREVAAGDWRLASAIDRFGLKVSYQDGKAVSVELL